MSHNTAHLTAEQRAMWERLVSIRTQQYSALVETERAMEAVNPRFTRTALSRQERRALRQERQGVYDNA